MPIESEILTYASALATLTYVLGGLIYMLPIPIKGLKDWGPIMIKEGIYATFWIAIYNFILNLANSISSLLGVSWQYYILTITGEEIGIALPYLLLSTALAFEHFFDGIPFLSSLVKTIGNAQALQVFVSTLGSILESIETIKAFSVLIEFATPFLIAIGILLMSLPFKIGKGTGAWLVSFSLVFYIGLPLLPSFSNSIILLILPTQAAILRLAITSPLSVIGSIASIIPMLQLYLVVIPIAYIAVLFGLSFIIAETISDFSERMPILIDIF